MGVTTQAIILITVHIIIQSIMIRIIIKNTAMVKATDTQVMCIIVVYIIMCDITVLADPIIGRDVSNYSFVENIASV
jgi:NADH:ubiquinone oxidoreductase subunit K